MKTRSNLRGWGRLLLCAAALLTWAGTATAQNSSNWLGGAATGNWNDPLNWDVVPVTGDTELNFGGTLQTSTVNNIGALTISQLNVNSDSAQNWSVGGSALTMANGTNPAQIARTGTSSPVFGRLLITAPVHFQTNSAIALGTNNNQGAEIFLNGPLSQTAGQTLSVGGTDIGVVLMVGSANNLGFNGTFSVAATTAVQTTAPNAFWRNTILTGAASSAAITAGTAGGATIGYGVVDSAFNQQWGDIRGNASYSIGTTISSATVITGFANSAINTAAVGGNIGGVNSDSHFGKVGTGSLGYTASSTSANLNISVRDGTFNLGGAGGAMFGPSATPGSVSVYAGAQLRLGANGVTVTAVNAALGEERLDNQAPMRLAGGVLRMDVSSTANYTENLGAMRPLAGMSQVLVNSSATNFGRFTFASVTEADLVRGGQVAFVGTALSVAPTAGQSNVTVTAAPTLSNGLIPWGLAQTNYVSAATSNTIQSGNPDTLAVMSGTSVLPLVVATPDVLGSGTADSRLTLPAVLAGASAANSVLFDAGGTLGLAGPFDLTSGAMMSRSPNAAITGVGVVNTTGRLYVSASAGNSLQVAPGVILQGTGFSKGGNGTVSVDGQFAVPAGSVISANAGTLNVSTAAVNSAGTAVFQVAKNATINFASTIQGTLRGNGTVGGPVTMASGSLIGGSSLGGDLGTGAAPGTMRFAAGSVLSMNGGARWRVYVTSAQTASGDNQYTMGMLRGDGTGGSGTATISFAGASPSNPVIIQPQTMTLNNNGNGTVYDMDQTGFTAYSWPIGSFSNILAFDANAFVVDTANYQGPGGLGFNVSQSGNQIFLNFVPFPEPALFGLVPFGLYMIARRRKA